MSSEASGILMILASLIMIVLGLQMLNLFPWLKRLQPRMPKFLAHKIHDLTEKEVKGGAFILGASTFFLPCGFTQALQLYVLAKGSFVTGVTHDAGVFAAGTLPALISLSMVSSFATGTFQKYFLKLAGVAVVILGFFNIQSGLTPRRASPELRWRASPTRNKPANRACNPSRLSMGSRSCDMKIVGYSYQLNRFAVVQGVPGGMADRRPNGVGMRPYHHRAEDRREKISSVGMNPRLLRSLPGYRRHRLQLRHGNDELGIAITVIPNPESGKSTALSTDVPASPAALEHGGGAIS